ncbi:MAG TPA: ABC transporter permease, partial [Thermoanaerobaculia bacterium]
SALFFLEGKNVPSPKEGAPVGTNAGDPKFFDTVGIHLIEGRNFNSSDNENSTPSIIINQSLRDRFYERGESPVGHNMKFIDVPTPWQIVGVVSDAKYTSLGEQVPNYFYYPFYQAYGAGEVTLFVRTKAAPTSVMGTVRREVQALDPNLPIYNVGIVSDVVTQSLWASRAAAALLIFFGVLGLVLATVGTYGVMSYQVDQTRREIGIRMALGELRSAILGRVIGRGMILVAAGIVVGIGVALFTSKLISTFLYGISATDLATFVATPLVLALAAFGATLVPARRATAVDPLRVLRSE